MTKEEKAAKKAGDYCKRHNVKVRNVERECDKCDGKGKIATDVYGGGIDVVTCPQCKGTGIENERICPECKREAP